MTAILLATLSAPLVAGAYAMPELCRRLAAATGSPHSVDAPLRDYPIFVAAKSGDPARVRKLVAAALHAEWKVEDGRYRLVAVKPSEPVDLSEFERLYRAACGGNRAYLALPVEDLYRLPPGRMLRYGPRRTETVKALPALNGESVTVRRIASGVFEFGGMRQIQFSGLPKNVGELVGEDLRKIAADDALRAELRKKLADPTAAKLDLSRQDPVAGLADGLLRSTAAAIKPDLAIVLHDFSLFALRSGADGNGQVESILGAYSETVDWTVADGAVVGRLPMCERVTPSQSNRTVLRKFIENLGLGGVVNVQNLGQYVASQRPAASESWSDVMLLVIGGAVIDQEYIGHYPFNVRLYGQLTKADWNVVRSGEPFSASTLSFGARRALADLLLQSRSCVGHDDPDPGRWPSVAPSRLSITAEVVDEPVLIGYTSFAASVDSVRTSAHNFDMRQRELGREPLYRPATRRKLKLRIVSLDDPNAVVVTGFSDVVPDPSVKASVWAKLPENIAKAFREALDEIRKINQGRSGEPPPQ